MRVIHIISDTNIGGAGIYLLTLLRNYDKSKFDTEVLLPKGAALIPMLCDTGARVTELNHIADKSADYKGITEISGILKQKRPDIIHTHAALAGRIAGRLYGGAKITATRHTAAEAGERTGLLKRAVNNILCDKFIAVSPVCAESLLAAGIKKEKIEVIYNGVEQPPELAADEKAKLRGKYGIPENAFTAALIGRMAKVKGHKTAVAAAALLKEETDIYFIFAGMGELSGEIKDTVDTNGLKNVILPGFVKDVYEILNIMDIQINASYNEATSLALLEGMSLGKPAVVSDAGGNPYVIEDGVNGFVYETGGVARLAEHILRLKNDSPLYDKLANGARAVYGDRFTARLMTQKTCGLYDALYQ